MSGPADTIRRPTAEEVLRQYVQSGSIMLQEPANGRRQVTAAEAIRALDALLAERQQAQEERDELRAALNLSQESCSAGWEQRQQAIDALREIAKTEDSFQAQSRYTGTVATAHHDCPSLARAALVKLGEQP